MYFRGLNMVENSGMYCRGLNMEENSGMYFRGLNMACNSYYIEPGTVKKPTADYQILSLRLSQGELFWCHPTTGI